jgi:hypothetical protein
MARIRRSLPDVVGWASAGRATLDAAAAASQAEGVGHLPLTLRLA